VVELKGRSRRLAYKALRLGISYLVLIVMAIWAIIPIYYVIMLSFSHVTKLLAVSIKDLVPTQVTLQAYRELLFGRFIPSIKAPDFPLWVAHSIMLAAATSLLSIALAMLAGYGLSRLDMPAKKTLATFTYIITFLPVTATTVPLYLLFAQLRLLNYYGLVLAYTPGTAVFAAFLAKLAIDSIPPDYEDAAMVDGLSRFGVFIRIVFRMAMPIVALTALLGFLGAYMDYATAYAFIGANSNQWTAMLGLYYLAGLYNYASAPNYNIFAAGAVLMGIPLMALFLMSQRMMTRAYSSLAGIK
jgi:arabinogalactan oligomer/maltooligosaccharide transport system permease protein